jgi:16S rRNA (cytidine1402-2'-O)-methyltransferase
LACEDTSVGARLLAANGVRRSIQRLDEHAPEHKIQSLLDVVASGKTLAFFSDAGTPSVSDPGAALVDAAHSRGIPVDAIPGPSAVMSALSLAGFYAQRFVFLGFLPRKAGAMSAEFAPYADSTTTIVYFEAPTRLKKSLETALKTLGERRVALCREMTKAHQEVVRLSLSELISQDRAFKGECTIVIEGMRRKVA